MDWKTYLQSLFLSLLVTLPGCVLAEPPVGRILLADRLEALQLQKSQMKDFDPDQDGAWPVNRRAHCGSIMTRDQASDEEIERTSTLTNNSGLACSDDCGVNMFMQAKRMEEDQYKRSFKRNTENSPTDNSDLVKLLRQVTDDLETGSTKTDKKDARLVRRLRTLLSKESRRLDQAQYYHVMTSKRLVDVEDPDVQDQEMETRIVGGQESVAGRYPFIAAVGKKTKGLACGATLINNRWLITAAHCFEDKEKPCDYNVRLGSFNWLVDDSGNHEDISPELIVRHPDFDDDTLQNDIALIKLSRDVELDADSYINGACILQDDNGPNTNEDVIAVGWGTLVEDAGNVPDTLQEVAIKVLTQSECNFQLTDKQFCAGTLDGGKDTCQGDSGGPLLVERNGHYYLAGVTSFGNGCGRKGWPGIYTKVCKYKEFINSVMNRNS